MVVFRGIVLLCGQAVCLADSRHMMFVSLLFTCYIDFKQKNIKLKHGVWFDHRCSI